jgi:tetratricopeptide (TPR) repeat protein
MKSWGFCRFGAVSTAALLLAAAPAHAEASGDAEAARALFREGRSLAAAAKYDEACPKFEQSLKLDAGIGTKFNLADCYEHTGRTATAHTLFLEVASIAREAGQGDREQIATARAKSLEPQLHTLTVNVKGKQSGLAIQRDGTEVAPSKWGTPEAVDPGAYELRVTAPGKKAWSQRVEVPRSGDATVEVPELKDADEAAAPAPATDANPADAPAEATEAAPAAATEEPPKPAPDITLPLIFYGGLGAGAVLAGTALVLYKSANDKAQGICPSGVNCSHDDIVKHQGYVNDARDARTLAYVGLGVTGAALLTSGAIALIRASNREHATQARITAAPVIGPNQLGATMEGRF